ncbi:MAG: hypothetical protein PVI75_05270 [Gammaproteobacteria bacterium]
MQISTTLHHSKNIENTIKECCNYILTPIKNETIKQNLIEVCKKIWGTSYEMSKDKNINKKTRKLILEIITNKNTKNDDKLKFFTIMTKLNINLSIKILKKIKRNPNKYQCEKILPKMLLSIIKTCIETNNTRIKQKYKKEYKIMMIKKKLSSGSSIKENLSVFYRLVELSPKQACEFITNKSFENKLKQEKIYYDVIKKITNELTKTYNYNNYFITGYFKSAKDCFELLQKDNEKQCLEKAFKYYKLTIYGLKKLVSNCTTKDLKKGYFKSNDEIYKSRSICDYSMKTLKKFDFAFNAIDKSISDIKIHKKIDCNLFNKMENLNKQIENMINKVNMVFTKKIEIPTNKPHNNQKNNFKL